jgi:transcriptional regulator with XRE-family HTH domain
MEKRCQNLVKLGKKIRVARKSKGFSREGLALQSGLARTYTGRVERGEQNISAQNLIKIAKALDVEVGELFPGIGELRMPKMKE